MLTQTSRREAKNHLTAAVLVGGFALGAVFSSDSHALTMYSASASLSGAGVPAGVEVAFLEADTFEFATGAGIASASAVPGADSALVEVSGMGGLETGNSEAAADLFYLLTPIDGAVDLSGESWDFSVSVSLTTNDPADEGDALAGVGVFLVDVTTDTLIETLFEEILFLSDESGFGTVDGTFDFVDFILEPGEGLAIELAAFGVPEPGPLLLLGGGLLALAGTRARSLWS